MFRIKTDIRQYKCDSQDKVEKLIRNWVIRPNDLIFSTDENAWNPIGEHPSFVKLFDLLEEQIRNEPDTVVTRDTPKAPKPVAPSEADARKDAGNGATDVAALAQTDEITNVKERPEGIEDEKDVQDEPEEATRIEVSPYAEEGEAEEENEEQDEQEEDVPTPPEAPDGVEGIIRSSDEITMMTERTADLVGEDSEAEDEAGAGEQAAGEQAAGEQAAGEQAAGEQATDEQSAGPTEATTIIDRAALDMDEKDEEQAAEIADATQDLRVDEQEEQDEQETHDDEEPEPGVPLGRHDLPEEFFATAEISSPILRDSVEPPLDELAELSDADEDREDKEETNELHVKAEDDEEAEQQDQAEDDQPSGWRIHLDDENMPDEEELESTNEDEDEDEDEEDQRSTHELTTTELQSIAEARREKDDDSDLVVAERIPTLDELIEDISEPTVDEEDDVEQDDDFEDDDFEDDDFEDDDFDDDDFDEEDLDEIAHVQPVRPVQDPDFVSAGYELPLPFEVKPSAEDIAMGLKQTRVGRGVKHHSFPSPRPKKFKEIIVREFDLTTPPPKDRSLVLVIGIILIFVAIIAIVAMW